MTCVTAMPAALEGGGVGEIALQHAAGRHQWIEEHLGQAIWQPKRGGAATTVKRKCFNIENGSTQQRSWRALSTATSDNGIKS